MRGGVGNDVPPLDTARYDRRSFDNVRAPFKYDPISSRTYINVKIQDINVRRVPSLVEVLYSKVQSASAKASPEDCGGVNLEIKLYGCTR